MKQQWMNLKVLLPTEVFLDGKAKKIVAEAGDGFFGLMPNHVDFVTALVPSIFSYWNEHDKEMIMAIDRGLLDELQKLIDETFDRFDDHDRSARSAMAKMEADLVRRLVELQ